MARSPRPFASGHGARRLGRGRREARRLEPLPRKSRGELHVPVDHRLYAPPPAHDRPRRAPHADDREGDRVGHHRADVRVAQRAQVLRRPHAEARVGPGPGVVVPHRERGRRGAGERLHGVRRARHDVRHHEVVDHGGVAADGPAQAEHDLAVEPGPGQAPAAPHRGREHEPPPGLGLGNRLISGVGAPGAVKSPPALPLLIAVPWKLFGTLPIVRATIGLLNPLASGAAAGMIWWIGRRKLGAAPAVLALCAIGPFFLDAVIQYFNIPLSEPYFVCGWATALLLAYRMADAPPEAARPSLAVTLGLVLALTVLFRTAGLVVLAPVLAALARERRPWREAAPCAR